jgi:hypothetical protein
LGYDERTIADWERRGGDHAQQVHAHLVEQEQVGLQHVQADELWVKLVGQRLWLALALGVLREGRQGALVGREGLACSQARPIPGGLRFRQGRREERAPAGAVRPPRALS